MADPLQVLDRMFTALGPEASAVPGRFDRFPGQLHRQSIEEKQVSRVSRVSRIAGGAADPSRDRSAGKPMVSIARARASDLLHEVPGNPGKPGSAGKEPILSTLFDFPPPSPETMLSGDEGELSPIMNRASAEPESPSASIDPGPPIPPGDVRAGVARELKALAALGRTGPTALRDAVEIVRAKIRNAPVLMERQAMINRCHVCTERLDATRPEMAVLQMKPGEALHMHAGECHDAHRHRRAAIVDGIMAAAGYGSRTAAEAASDALNDGHYLPDLRDT